MVFGVKAEVDFVFDDDGNWGFAATGQGLSPGVGVGAGPGGGIYWKADTIDDLAGPIASIGGSAYNIGLELEFCREKDGIFNLCGLEGGYGAEGWVVSGYAAAGGTGVLNMSRLLRLLDKAESGSRKPSVTTGATTNTPHSTSFYVGPEMQ